MRPAAWVIRSLHSAGLFLCPATSLWWPVGQISAQHALPGHLAVRRDLPCGGIWSRLSDADLDPVPAWIGDEQVSAIVDIGPWARRRGLDVVSGERLPDAEARDCIATLQVMGHPDLARIARAGREALDRLSVHAAKTMHIPMTPAPAEEPAEPRP